MINKPAAVNCTDHCVVSSVGQTCCNLSDHEEAYSLSGSQRRLWPITIASNFRMRSFNSLNTAAQQRKQSLKFMGGIGKKIGLIVHKHLHYSFKLLPVRYIIFIDCLKKNVTTFCALVIYQKMSILGTKENGINICRKRGFNYVR